MKKKVFLVDGSGYIFRAFYAVAPLTTKQGFPTNALFGYTRMLTKLLKEADSEHVVVVFDAARKNFRHDLYAEYKANRVECPPELSKQMPYFRQISSSLGLQILEQEGLEADDIIGTLVTRLNSPDIEVVIVSGDKDLMQLVSDKVSIWDTMKDAKIYAAQVEEKFGVPPNKVVEVLALIGDSSDNVPGLDGVGPKTAAQLIKKYDNIENVINQKDQVLNDPEIKNRKKIVEQIELNEKLLRLCKRLVQVELNADFKLNINSKDAVEVSSLNPDQLYSKLVRQSPNTEKLNQLAEEFEFKNLFTGLKLISAEAPKENKKLDFKLVLNNDFEKFIADLKNQKAFAFDLETDSLNPREAKIVGISFCWNDSTAYYLPLGHQAQGQVKSTIALAALKPIFENSQIQKVGQNLKYDISVLIKYDLVVDGVHFDTMLASYLLHPDRRAHHLGELAQTYLNRNMKDFDEVLGSNLDFSFVDLQAARDYSCDDAYVTWNVKNKLAEEIKANNLEQIFYEIEMPLVSILASMESKGIKLDVDCLAKMSEEFALELAKIEQTVYQLAGQEFNMNSPKQMAQILFEKLQIPTKGLKKTKTGISTDSSVLEKLELDYPISAQILRYRVVHKLKSTYIDSLPQQVFAKTGRVHSSFHQSGTATGRLSSSDPNLQNIPISTAEGKRIRTAFIPEAGKIFISADYSQIELRVLAELSQDQNLINAFKNDLDIHSCTAREILNLKPDAEISTEMRRIGKTINFGVIYGMGPYRLSRELQIPMNVAKDYIENYFNKYPGIKQYFAKLEQEVTQNNFVTTLMGRKRMFSDIDRSGRDDGYALRAALNAPLQGTAADIIKMAMIKIDQTIKAQKLPIDLILQVHDELLFELDLSLKDTAIELISKEMENVVKLSVPLKVDIRSGYSWAEVH